MGKAVLQECVLPSCASTGHEGSFIRDWNKNTADGKELQVLKVLPILQQEECWENLGSLKNSKNGVEAKLCEEAAAGFQLHSSSEKKLDANLLFVGIALQLVESLGCSQMLLYQLGSKWFLITLSSM